MPQYSRTELANRTLDIVGKASVLDIDTATDAISKLIERNFNPIFLRCLRRFDWPFALKRISLNPTGTSPINEFSFAFELPSDYVRLAAISPSGIAHKLEGTQVLCNEQAITIKYVSNDCITIPAKLDPDFAEYFSHELAIAISYKITDSVQLREELRKMAQSLFAEATALLSQEGTDDPLPESPWITERYGCGFTSDEIRISGLE